MNPDNQNGQQPPYTPPQPQQQPPQYGQPQQSQQPMQPSQEPNYTQQYQQPPQNPVQQPMARPSNPQSGKLHPMVVLQPGERVVFTLKRHPFGILSLYFSGIVAIVLLALLAFYLVPNVLNQNDFGSNANTFVYGGMGVLVVLMILILFIATSVYWENQWIVTTDSITQISQNSLFGRQVSQLSMDNLEDVTVDQNGILPHMFNFGLLKVETAGERSKFQFPYCPDPNNYARKILEIHEQFLEDRRNIQNRP
jgi:hypothetical protein